MKFQWEMEMTSIFFKVFSSRKTKKHMLLFWNLLIKNIGVPSFFSRGTREGLIN